MLYHEREKKINRLFQLLSMNKIYTSGYASIHDASTGAFICFSIKLINRYMIEYDPQDDPDVGLAAALMVYDLPELRVEA